MPLAPRARELEYAVRTLRLLSNFLTLKYYASSRILRRSMRNQSTIKDRTFYAWLLNADTNCAIWESMAQQHRVLIGMSTEFCVWFSLPTSPLVDLL